MTPEDLVNEPFSSYRLMSSARRICLPPRYLGNVSQGIRDQLDSEINLYCSDLESVVVCYENLKLLQAVGSILDDSPFLHFRIQADFLVFKPTIGCILKGIVNKVSKDHVGCLVHNRFNASIHRPRQNLNGWKGSQLQQGEEFPFEVQDIYSNNAVISLKGKLVDQKIIEAYLKSLQAERGGTKAAKDKPVDSGAFIDTVEGEITLDNDPVLKKKRRRESSVSENLNDILDGKPPAAKKKKKKKDKEASDQEYSFISQTPKMESVVHRNDVPSTPFAGKKRKHSIETNTVSEAEITCKVGLLSAKKVRFDSSDSEKKKKTKVQDSSLDDAVISELGDRSFVDSFFLDDSLTQTAKKKKKKKHKKARESLSEDLDVTKLKDKSVLSAEMKDSVTEIPLDTLDQDPTLKVCDPDQRSPKELSEKRKKKKNKDKQKNLVNVVIALQSEVTKVASKLQTPSPPSSRKQKQKKKKHRESSISPERDISVDMPKGKSEWKSKSYALDNRLSANGAGDSDTKVPENMDVSFSESSSKKKKRHSVGDSNVIEEVTTKRKKSKPKNKRD